MYKICLCILLIILSLRVLHRNDTKYEIKYNLKNIVDGAYVISLNNELGDKKWKKMNDHPYLKNKITRFPGVIGKNLNKYDPNLRKLIKLHWDKGKWLGNPSEFVAMSDGEIGCALSHYKLWKHLYTNPKLEKIIIFEDDATHLDVDFFKKTEKVIKSAPADWDIILLGFWLFKGNFGKKVSKNMYKVNRFVLLHSYIINKKGAKKLLSMAPIDSPVDSWMTDVSDKINIYRHTYTYNHNNDCFSSLIKQNNMPSEIIHTVHI